MVSQDVPLLPTGWRWAPIRAVCDLVGEVVNPKGTPGRMFAHYSIPAFDANQRPVVETGASILSSKILFPNGCVLFSKLNPRISRAWYVNDTHDLPRVCSTEFLPLVPREASMGPTFLSLLLQEPSFRTRLRVKAAAATKSRERLRPRDVLDAVVPVPPVSEQERIAVLLHEELRAVEQARAAAEDALGLLSSVTYAFLTQSLRETATMVKLADCLKEVSNGVGDQWRHYPVLGATRSGLAPGKEPVGRTPERYKFVDRGTIFYNPMRILLGSIAMVDEDDQPGITSPDYVVFRTTDGILHARWFYAWLRSPQGDSFVRSLARGAVRERMLFRRLAAAEVAIPPWTTQLKVARSLIEASRMRTLVSEQRLTINTLPAAMLRQAFSGEL